MGFQADSCISPDMTVDITFGGLSSVGAGMPATVAKGCRPRSTLSVGTTVPLSAIRPQSKAPGCPSLRLVLKGRGAPSGQQVMLRATLCMTQMSPRPVHLGGLRRGEPGIHSPAVVPRRRAVSPAIVPPRLSWLPAAEPARHALGLPWQLHTAVLPHAGDLLPRSRQAIALSCIVLRADNKPLATP